MEGKTASVQPKTSPGADTSPKPLSSLSFTLLSSSTEKKVFRHYPRDYILKINQYSVNRMKGKVRNVNSAIFSMLKVQIIS